MNIHALIRARSPARPAADPGERRLRPGTSLARRGSLEVRLAASQEDINASQALRYEVFYEELSARPDEIAAREKKDSDGFDQICDHLLVIDHDVKAGAAGSVSALHGAVVGTYRLLRQQTAERHGGFYTAAEFDIAPLIAANPDLDFLELGRSCVLRDYRNKPTVELLWQGIWNYVRFYKCDVMLGCASLEGTDPDALALPLSCLHHHFRAPPEWDARAWPARYVEMNRMPAAEVDMRSAMRSLPPLIKGYLRLGAYVGDGAVIDEQFATTDVLIILPVSAIDERYFAHFGGPDENPLAARR